MKCTNPECGAENPEEANFCRACGRKIERQQIEEPPQMVSCPECGKANRVGFTICRKCGYKPVGLKCPTCGNTDLEADDAFCWKCESPLHLGGGDKPYASCQVGDHFFFGSYPQGQNGEVEPIEWRVLARESDRLLVISEYGLDAKAYNEKFEDITWSKCTLRTWLNGEFLNKAFTAEEQQNLLKVTLSNPNSHWNSSVLGGPNTEDRVFLLSYAEAENYFSGDGERCCKATAYAVEQGAWVVDDDENVAYADNCWWWLRSPGYRANRAADVLSDGSLYNYVDVGGGFGVRPAAFMAL